mgnify:CR=1 FL=1
MTSLLVPSWVVHPSESEHASVCSSVVQASGPVAFLSALNAETDCHSGAGPASETKPDRTDVPGVEVELGEWWTCELRHDCAEHSRGCLGAGVDIALGAAVESWGRHRPSHPLCLPLLWLLTSMLPC